MVATNVASIRLRFTNAVRCYASYALSLLGSVRIVHAPMFVSVEPAAVCQLRCPECPVGQSKIKSEVFRLKNEPFMSLDIWHRVLSEIRDTAFVVQFYFQGEPLLNRDLPRMIREAHEAGLYTIVSTNAQAMTTDLAAQLIEAGLSRIIVSMDGLSQETYGAYRVGGNVERCKQALRWLHDEKKRQHGHTLIELQCLRLRSNEHEWHELKKHYRAFGADRFVLKTAQLYDYENGHALMPTNLRYARYRIESDGRYHRKPMGKGCLRVWSGCVVTTTGEVLPCCYDKAHQYAYGNIMNRPLRELFCSEKAIAFRRAAIKEQPPICKECGR